MREGQPNLLLPKQTAEYMVAKPFAQPLLWISFILYLILAAIGIAHHEMWGDEIHSWNIAKGSYHFSELISNSRYEGHPPVWYIILWCISKFTHDPLYVQIIHILIAGMSAFIILFYSPFPLLTRILMPFGYFFLFEYAIISRNYAVGVLLTLCICIGLYRNFRYKIAIYYLLLFLLTNTHLQALLLAGCLHLYFLLSINKQQVSKTKLTIHVLIGLVMAIPALYFIFPPPDSQLNTRFWMDRWSFSRVSAFAEGPLRAFLPIPAWWNYNIWNTQFLIEAKKSYTIFRFVNVIVAFGFLLVPIFILKRNKKSLALFLAHLILSFALAVTVITLTAGRHAGFIFLSFIAAYWFYCYAMKPAPLTNLLVNILLVLQVAGAGMMLAKDWQYPFSRFNKVNELLDKVPANEQVVSDYWALNSIATFADKPFYCLETQREESFLLWNADLGNALKSKSRYADNLRIYFQKTNVDTVYMLSSGTMEMLMRVDSVLAKLYHIELVDKRDGAMEKAGNLYLYRVWKGG